MSGKGDTQRPAAIGPEEFATRWPMQRVGAPADAVYVAGKGWMNPCRQCMAGWRCLCGHEARDAFRITWEVLP